MSETLTVWPRGAHENSIGGWAFIAVRPNGRRFFCTSDALYQTSDLESELEAVLGILAYLPLAYHLQIQIIHKSAYIAIVNYIAGKIMATSNEVSLLGKINTVTHLRYRLFGTNVQYNYLAHPGGHAEELLIEAYEMALQETFTLRERNNAI